MPSYLKEPFQPPDLENAVCKKNSQLEKTPPFHAAICTLGGVSMGAFADNDVLLLILDVGKLFGQFFH